LINSTLKYSIPQQWIDTFANDNKEYSRDYGYVYLVDDKIVGFILVGAARKPILSIFENNEIVMFIHSLVVHPDFRRRGIGRKLIKGAKMSTKHSLHLLVKTDNLPMLALCKEEEFKKVTLLRNVYKREENSKKKFYRRILFEIFDATIFLGLLFRH